MKMAALVVLIGALSMGTGAVAGSAQLDEPDGCAAINPAQPTCTFVATGVDTFGGVAGNGSWIVKVKVGKRTTTYKSPASGEPTGIQFMIPAGAKVTATATAAGSGVVVGGE